MATFQSGRKHWCPSVLEYRQRFLNTQIWHIMSDKTRVFKAIRELLGTRTCTVHTTSSSNERKITTYGSIMDYGVWSANGNIPRLTNKNIIH